MNKVPSKNYGFSLLEILISLVIMSVGMMGLAGLKMVSIKGTNEAHFRHEASLIMMDLADRMRLNQEGVDSGSYKAATAVGYASQPNPDCSSGECNSSELAAFDKYSIAKRMSEAIPGSSLIITCPNTTCKTVVIKAEHTLTISWKEKKDKTEALTKTIMVGDSITEVADEFNTRAISLTVTP